MKQFLLLFIITSIAHFQVDAQTNIPSDTPSTIQSNKSKFSIDAFGNLGSSSLGSKENYTEKVGLALGYNLVEKLGFHVGYDLTKIFEQSENQKRFPEGRYQESFQITGGFIYEFKPYLCATTRYGTSLFGNKINTFDLGIRIYTPIEIAYLELG